MNLLDLPLIRRIRRNHGVEHATIHVLGRGFPHVHMAGRATEDGFMLYGNLPTEAVGNAVTEALDRLRAGEHHLAVHPRCGTNLVVAGILAGLSSLIVTADRHRSMFDYVPRLFLATTAAVLLAQPLGPIVQERVTTLPDVNRLRVGEITQQHVAKWTMHHVRLEEV